MKIWTPRCTNVRTSTEFTKQYILLNKVLRIAATQLLKLLIKAYAATSTLVHSETRERLEAILANCFVAGVLLPLCLSPRSTDRPTDDRVVTRSIFSNAAASAATSFLSFNAICRRRAAVMNGAFCFLPTFLPLYLLFVALEAAAAAFGAESNRPPASPHVYKRVSASARQIFLLTSCARPPDRPAMAINALRVIPSQPTSVR